MTNSTKTQFDLDRATTIAARYGSDIRELETEVTNSGMYEATLFFEDSDLGLVNITYLDSVWTCDPYFAGDPSFTPDQMRSVAATMVTAAQLAQELNA
jgi:hypothetical protein